MKKTGDKDQESLLKIAYLNQHDLRTAFSKSQTAMQQDPNIYIYIYIKFSSHSHILN